MSDAHPLPFAESRRDERQMVVLDEHGRLGRRQLLLDRGREAGVDRLIGLPIF